MPRDGFSLKLAGDKSEGEIRSRRCHEEQPDGQMVEVVELTFETFSPHWILASLNLTPCQALELGMSLVHEAALPMSSDGLFHPVNEAAV